MATKVINRRHPGTIFIIPGSHPGLVIGGNINLWQQPVIRNPDGSYSTVHSFSTGFTLTVDGKNRNLQVLMTEVWPGLKAVASQGAAIQHFRSTGAHLGMFDTVPHANRYAERLHLWFVANAKWFVPPTIKRKK
jgi:hypothetical protein